MVRCFLTGVEFHLDSAYILNRRDARDLLNELKDRVNCLQRVIDQLSPLDAYETKPYGRTGNGASAPKKHRLVCKTVADALAPGFPEISLFLSWPEYRSRTQRSALHVMHGESLPRGATTALDKQEAPVAGTKLQEHETGDSS